MSTVDYFSCRAPASGGGGGAGDVVDEGVLGEGVVDGDAADADVDVETVDHCDTSCVGSRSVHSGVQ